MRVAIVAPQPVPNVVGGAERAVEGLRAAIAEREGHRAEIVKLPVDERALPGIVKGYAAFSDLDLHAFDLVVSVKYPAWALRHPRHVVLMFHPLRGLYDGYAAVGLPRWEEARDATVERATATLESDATDDAEARAALRVLKEHLPELEAGHPDLRFPGPVSRRIVHALDRRALRRPRVQQHLALSRTVACRPGYLPDGLLPRVVRLPGALPLGPDLSTSASAMTGPRHGLFTASRLDGAKRLGLLVDAMAEVPGDVPLTIAGTGPDAKTLRARAAHDPRIRFVGHLDDDALRRHYAEAVAVPFVPLDEDLGLVTLEACRQSTPVVTTTDSGGPTELVVDGLNGRVVPPTSADLGRALAEVVADPETAAAWGRAGRARVATITWDTVVDAVLDEPTTSATPPTMPPGGDDRRRAVVLTTFPIDQPTSGGQIRARHLYGALASHLEVHVLALGASTDAPGTTHLGPGFTQELVARSPAHLAAGEEASARAGVPVTDIVAGTHLDLTPELARRATELVRPSDVVVLAEPYLSPVLEGAPAGATVVYDAYNVEVALKDALLPRGDVGDDLRRAVRQAEATAVASSALVVACSDEVATGLVDAHGPIPGTVTIVPNGATVPHAALLAPRRAGTPSTTTRALRSLGDGPEREVVAVFVGSWHPPNIEAAEILLELAPEVPEVQILCVGHHGVAFEHRVLPDNVAFTGRIGDRARRSLLAHVDLAVNPMRSGSGTNLKLLEYLAWEIPTLSTPFGARGIDVRDGEHLTLAEVEHLPDALRAMVADEPGRRARAEAGRRFVIEHHDWVSLADRFVEAVEGAVRR